MANQNVLVLGNITVGAGQTGTLPAAITLPGTYNSVGVYVTGIGDASTTLSNKTIKGEYLYSSSNNELRKILGHSSNPATLILESAFTVNVTGDNVQLCRPLYRSLVVKNTGATDINIFDGAVATTDAYVANSDYGIAPTVYDTLSSSMSITTGY